jgi:hypothetical protein
MKKLKTFSAVCALLVAGVFVFVIGSVVKTRRDAKVLIGELSELSVSKSPNDTFDAFWWKYGRSWKNSDECTMHFCTYEAEISNNAIARLHIEPYTEMKIWFRVDRGALVTTMIEYRSARKGPNSPVVHVQQDVCGPGCGVRFDVNPHGTTEQMWNGFVEFNANATQAQRDAALAFNLDCFSRIGGCKDITELLPTVWRRADSGKIKSQLVGLSQRLEESHGFPSPEDF